MFFSLHLLMAVRLFVCLCAIWMACSAANTPTLGMARTEHIRAHTRLCCVHCMFMILANDYTQLLQLECFELGVRTVCIHRCQEAMGLPTKPTALSNGIKAE